eukprot:TRINITY_DN51215_c0_g1_i2.p1 TRINITY_DN51215_c0_g1~~TRINITY_DN51215_c0_g1_i2.p1  ORF type:complete len:253 (-),score=32.32 TRINITY_DN51215_c0_g1_i2:179-937(-)
MCIRDSINAEYMGTFDTKMREILPSSLQPFIVNEIASFKFDAPECAGHCDAQIVADRIMEKMNSEQLLTFIRSSHLESEGEALFEVVASCIFNLAQKSIEHFNRLIDRYSELLSILQKENSKEGMLFGILYEMYQSSSTLLKYAIDKLLAQNLLSPQHIISQSCRLLASDRISDPDLWNLVCDHNSILYNVPELDLIPIILTEIEKSLGPLTGIFEKQIIKEHLLQFINSHKQVFRENPDYTKRALLLAGIQ